MVFGISLSTYTTIHVIISLIAIVAGFIAVFGMTAGKPARRLEHDLPLDDHRSPA